MKCLSKTIFRIFCVILLSLHCFVKKSNAQQKAMYTQYMFNGLAINPAYSAMDEALTITALSRHQWVGFKGAPNTQTFSIHTPIKESNTSVGALIMRDQIGEVITEKGAYLTLAQRVPIGENSYLAVGFNGGLSSYQANFSDNFGSSPLSINDPVFNNQNNWRGNFGAGVIFFTKQFFVGLSSPHFYYRDFGSFNEGNSTTYRPHYLLQSAYLIPVSEQLKVKPNLLIKYVNGSPIQFDMNVNVLLYETLWVGASYRSLDSFDALAQIFITPTLALGYSYDFAATDLAKVQQGTHEISLQFRLPVKGRDFPRCYF
ncbi:type IX secretion system membrane protein PorP/SprF [Pedobacter sp. HMF7647]|uniref:Type IX secretion system membrane protein PorP/SprF n=1 Tax=Hufsiella arboris TaxID=2695275 RepID=A0A7K1YEZ6_9SPHI|nr:type IX secretion system membrane protein PorP/SprF [Hufsiella arboris]MXV52618.1 type IX secretion system membrane protein PorP/SprF [Hufsiella arboris]